MFTKVANKFIIKLIILIIPFFSLFSQSADTLRPVPEKSNPLISGVKLFGSFTIVINDAGFRELPGLPNCCPLFGGNAGTGGAAGIGVFKKISGPYSAGLNVAYTYMSTDFTADEETNVIVSGGSVPGVFRHYLRTEFSSVDFNPYFSWTPWKKLVLSPGIAMSYVMKGDYLQYEKIVDPPDRGTFSDGTRVRNYSKGSLRGFNRLLFGPTLNIAWTLNLDREKTFFLSPYINYCYYINNYYNSVPWDMHIFNAGLELSMKTEKPVPRVVVPPLPPPLPRIPLPGLPALLHGIIAVHPVDRGKEDTIVAEEFASFNMKPLLNYIFFEKDSFSIPGRYRKFTESEAGSFAIHSVDSLNLLETYYQVLNIMGYRMKARPDSKITITGYNSGKGSEKNNTALSRKRAESVRDYFIKVWAVDSNRIAVAGDNLPDNPSSNEFPIGEDENRRVEIHSNDSSITESIFNIDTICIVRNPEVEVMTEVSAEAGLKSKNIRIMSGEAVVKEIEGSSREKENFVLRLDSLGINPKKLGNLDVVMILADKDNQVCSTPKATINVNRLSLERKRVERRADKKFEFYSLMLFDFAGAELSAEHLKAIDYIRGRIDAGAVVSITGYSDVIGDEKRNKKISESRAKAVADKLGFRNSSIEGVGEAVLLFDNTYPEGRFYCRTVNIKIENPVR